VGKTAVQYGQNQQYDSDLGRKSDERYQKEREGNKEAMMNEFAIRFFGWSAYANGLLLIANMVTIVLMFAVSLYWGPVNDALSVVWMLSFLPLALLLYQLNQPVAGRGIALVTAFVGVVAMLLFAGLQYLLVVGQVRFEETFAAVVTLGGVVGLWLLVNGLLAHKGKTLPAGLTWIMVIFGVSYVLGTVGFWLGGGGYEQPLLWLGAALGYLVGPIWAFWLGWLLLHARVPMSVLDRAGGHPL
jgi:hypothetical protein